MGDLGTKILVLFSEAERRLTIVVVTSNLKLLFDFLIWNMKLEKGSKQIQLRILQH